MGFDLVIFDCDGVLIDSELLSVRADRDALAECGIELSVEEILERYTGISFAGMAADLETRHGPLPSDFADRHRRHLWPLFERELRAIPGVTDVLDALTCKTCVASSGRPDRLRHALSLVGLYDRFSPNIFSAVEVAHGKPAPDLFLHAAERMGVPPGRCVVIEDSLPGVTAAVAAGMTVIGFVGASHCRPGDAARLATAGRGRGDR
jgi:HAD superfamily hydrolase (TIGR01509 family)